MGSRDAPPRPPGFLQRSEGGPRVHSAIFPRAERPARAWQAASLGAAPQEGPPDEEAVALAAAEAAEAAAQAQIAALFTDKLGAVLERLHDVTVQLAAGGRTGALGGGLLL